MNNNIFNISNSGLFSIDVSEIKQSFEDAYKKALGDINTDTSSPIGQLIAIDTITLQNAIEQTIKIINSSSVYYAKGDFLDNIATNYGYFRKKAIPQSVTAKIQGTPNTKIPKNTIASDGENDYSLIQDLTLPESGLVYGRFVCYKQGICKAGSLQTLKIENQNLRIINETQGSPFIEEESDNDFRDRIISNFLSLRSSSLLEGLQDSLLSLPDVKDAVVLENTKSENAQVQTQTLPPHSIQIIIDGGQDHKIAEIIAKKKTLGAQTVGNTEISYVHNNYNFQYKIQRPSIQSVFLKIVYNKNKYSNKNIEDEIKKTISEYLINYPKKIGAFIRGIEFYRAFDSFKQADILDIKVSKDGKFSDFIKLNIDQIPLFNNIKVEANV